MELQSSPTPLPHVLIFPLPVQGHVTPMLNLAELFCLQNLKVTFLNTTHNHKSLLQHTNTRERFARYPGFKFETISDELSSDDGARTGQSHLKEWLKELVRRLAENAQLLLREVMDGRREKVTCLIIDGWLSFANDIANEVGVPVISFRCTSASCISTYFSIPKLIEAGDVPFNDEEMDKLVKNAPGMGSFLRCRDLPTFCRNQDTSSCHGLQDLFKGELNRNQQAYSFILNTFEDLEGLTLPHIRSHCSRVYTIGPLHAHLKYRLGVEETKSPAHGHFSSNLLEVDRTCISWLDQKPDKSVVYVSFGSLTTLTRERLLEFWAGLVESKKYFLWVIRPNLITGSDTDSQTPDELLDGTQKRGRVVGWAPQDEVLAHRAIGGFLTHSGWNSTLESIVAGVPMLCWPFFADQQVNSRFVSEVWRIGLDMKDTCDRTIVTKMINDLMDEKKDELQRSMNKITHLAKMSISKGGSSYNNLDQLIEDIRAMAKK